CATRCACSSPRRWRSSARPARASCASAERLRGAVAILDRTIARLLPAVPRPIVSRISARYIAGPDLMDACRAVRELNERGKLATIDVLGEAVGSDAEAAAVVEEY